MSTFNLKIISENKSIQAEADSFESSSRNIRAKASPQLTFDGDGKSPYMLDEIQTIKSPTWIEPSRHVYVLQQ